ncbi:MAG: hypothetical protein D6726_00760 [Nitrospirae bacterium]|nr:MAG: hypothetical protein D6726_00760 [Nitrospirota bacterium]
MKLLLFYAHRFSYRTFSKTLPDMPDREGDGEMSSAVVVFFHVEKEDEANRKSVLQKFLKNTKWLAGKFGTKKVVLHSFNHLSTSKSSPEFAYGLLNEVEERLRNTGYEVMTTPFGYFNEFQIHVAGDSLAKVFKEF